MNDNIPLLLDSLAARLCQRRALMPLWRFLSAYFSLNGLTDGWQQCYDCLRDLRALCGNDLQPDELRDVNVLINRIGQMLEKQELITGIQKDIAQSLEKKTKDHV